MPTFRRFIARMVIAALVCASGAANAERVNFDSAAKDSRMDQIFRGQTQYSDHIHGELQLPSKGSGPFPAMVIMHSSRGVVGTIWDWAKMFNDMGIATFVVDSFTPRGLSENSADQLLFSAGVVDSLRALQTLQHVAAIDSSNIGVIGFSRGAVAAMNSSFERYRASVLGADSAKFALHIVFYGGCGQYAKTTGSPILSFLGTADDFNNLALCRKDTEMLNRLGSKAELVVYEGALHGFDTDFPRQDMPRIQNFNHCQLLLNLDTFEATLLDGRGLAAEEQARYPKSCAGYGASRGGDRTFAAAARARVRQFVAEQFKLAR